ncbi:MAG: hypothetical protein LBB80_08515 [Treponema sp.]|jgi:uncharacterized integral membrane protein|nr:hypothetical protein [Treponema sp.]
MPLRLLGFIIILVVFLLFITLNLENRCDIRFWVTETAILQKVPVYLTAFSAFVAGMLCAFPVMFLLYFKKRKREKDPTGNRTLESKKKPGKFRNEEGEEGTPGAY